MATRRKRRASAGFGGGLATSMIQQRSRSQGRTARPAQTPIVAQQPQRIPGAQDISMQPGALSGGTGTYDLMSDPAVAAASGLAQKMRAQATAMALAKRKQAAIEYGDPTGVEGVDEETAKAARENPFSVLKNLDRSYEKGVGDLEEGLNQANLHYSGYRGKQLADASTAHQGSRYQAGTNFKGLMSDVNNQLANALLSADAMEAQSMMNSSGGYYDGGGYDQGQAQQSVNPVGARSIIPAGYFGQQPAVAPKKKPAAYASFGGGLAGALIGYR